MTNYEAIKNMNMQEMAGVMFSFILPFLNGDNYSKAEKIKAFKQIEDFLKKEVK